MIARVCLCRPLQMVFPSAFFVSSLLLSGAAAQDGREPAPAESSAATAAPVPGEPLSASDPPKGCSDCHNGAADARIPGSPYPLLAGSSHASLDCTDCHASISMDDLIVDSPKPHGTAIDVVDCADCHEDESEVYQKHGRLEVGKDPDLPKCWSCHGTHEILPSTDRQSHVHQINLPGTCRACHTDVDLVKKHDILRDKPIRLYETSVHGTSTRKGLYVSATCNDCHNAEAADGKRTAHRILSPADPDSTIYHFNIPDTCGQCHANVTKDFWDGIHGQMVKRGSLESPVCTHCHGEHGIISSDNPLSPVSAARVAEETCAPCHESPVLNEKFGRTTGRHVSYIDSYHGLKSKAGGVTVATCASCHGSHRILPATDPTSSIHAENLRATCGECHPGISSELAQTCIHEAVSEVTTGWPHFFTVLYYWLIGVTISAMLLYCLADWLRQVRNMGTKPFVLRLSVNETLQHWILAISFVVLVISGFSLRFSEAWWVQLLFGWGGGEGFLIRGLVHRVAAIVFVVCSVWHMGYLCTKRGRRLFRDIVPSLSDCAHIKQQVLYVLGVQKHKPAFRRFSYMEKIEYWALVWGSVIMTFTGVLLAFDDWFVERWAIPKGFLDVMLVIHYFEAWLATLAILIWHGYSTVISPEVYPMNPAWLSGKMPRDMYTHEHPAGPKLKAYVHRKLYEEEEEAAEQPGMVPLAAEKEAPKGHVLGSATPEVSVGSVKDDATTE